MYYDIICIHHPSRPWPTQITDQFPNVQVLTDTYELGCPAMHWKALANIRDHTPTVIVEDDAMPTTDCAKKLSAWLDRWLCEGEMEADVISFYLGKGAPVTAQPLIKTWVETADRMHRDYIQTGSLYHSVAYVIHPDKVKDVEQQLGWHPLNKNAPIDLILGDMAGGNILYTLPSLFDHMDMPSLIDHRGLRPQEERRAWRFVA